MFIIFNIQYTCNELIFEIIYLPVYSVIIEAYINDASGIALSTE